MTASEGAPDGDPRSDAELIARVRATGPGSDAGHAFGILYARHEDAARTLARQLARSPADADDLVAGAFTRLLEVLRAGRGPTEAFRAYLLTSLRHLAYDRTRAERRLTVTGEIGEVTGVDPGATVVPFHDAALAGLERTLAARAFATLPERWQAVLWHLEVEEDTPADIAPLFGLSANAVSALGYRAREGLRQAYLQQHLAAGSGRWDRRHRETGERLGAYTRGGLSRRDAARVEEHLAECEECGGLAGELREVNSGMLRAVVAPLVLGAGLVGYLAARGGPPPVGLDASTGELAVAGGGVLGVVGALGAAVTPFPLRRPVLPASWAGPAGAAAIAGVVGLAGAAGVAFVLGGGPVPAPLAPAAPTAALPPPVLPPRAPVVPVLPPVPGAPVPGARVPGARGGGALDARELLSFDDDGARGPGAADRAGGRAVPRRAGSPRATGSGTGSDGLAIRIGSGTGSGVPTRTTARLAPVDGCAVTAPLPVLDAVCVIDGTGTTGVGRSLDSRR